MWTEEFYSIVDGLGYNEVEGGELMSIISREDFDKLKGIPETKPQARRTFLDKLRGKLRIGLSDLGTSTSTAFIGCITEHHLHNMAHLRIPVCVQPTSFRCITLHFVWPSSTWDASGYVVIWACMHWNFGDLSSLQLRHCAVTTSSSCANPLGFRCVINLSCTVSWPRAH